MSLTTPVCGFFAVTFTTVVDLLYTKRMNVFRGLYIGGMEQKIILEFENL